MRVRPPRRHPDRNPANERSSTRLLKRSMPPEADLRGGAAGPVGGRRDPAIRPARPIAGDRGRQRPALYHHQPGQDRAGRGPAAFIGTYAGAALLPLTRAVMAATGCPIALGTIITDDYLDIMGTAYGRMIEVNDEEARVGYDHYNRVTLAIF